MAVIVIKDTKKEPQEPRPIIILGASGGSRK